MSGWMDGLRVRCWNGKMGRALLKRARGVCGYKIEGLRLKTWFRFRTSQRKLQDARYGKKSMGMLGTRILYFFILLPQNYRN